MPHSLKLGLPMFLVAFVVFTAALYGGAQLVTPEPVDEAVNDVPVGPGPVSATVVSQTLRFTPQRLTANAGADFTVTHENRDAGVPHDLVFYTTPAATTLIFRSELITGPTTITFTFTAPSAPGNYFFRCDVHPDTMTGIFAVQ